MSAYRYEVMPWDPGADALTPHFVRALVKLHDVPTREVAFNWLCVATAANSGTPVGVARMYIAEPIHWGCDTGVFVDPPHRHRGIAQKMFDHLIRTFDLHTVHARTTTRAGRSLAEKMKKDLAGVAISIESV